MRRLALMLLDSGPVIVLAAIAGAGSFTHIRDTAIDHGQTGWMSWAVAVCVDLTCVMAARERQRDKRTGRTRHGLMSWPTLVLVAGIVLSLAANLQQAEPTVWGWLTAAIPAGAFLVAVSMLERRATDPKPEAGLQTEPVPMPSSLPDRPVLVPADSSNQDETTDPAPVLLDYARRVADEHHTKHGKPITRDALRARLGVSNQLASQLLRDLRPVREPA
ncbi:DUF2637 domain-containing protein [Acrocarpospora macrocephala]|uniref:SpdA protein n=1 Tax=Acrocarpospora macrocephala TaxID=150177 RepID=A0A5M3WGY2_9ACTN|nr:DUF2637 domain-containing protein [Acrocarpospora macrocephala]GES07550.1 SpdA protein [Acrocarpospora macrocephala]